MSDLKIFTDNIEPEALNQIYTLVKQPAFADCKASDWEDMEGERHGWYVVEKAPHNSPTFRGKRGWFPVWIIRLGEWY